MINIKRVNRDIANSIDAIESNLGDNFEGQPIVSWTDKHLLFIIQKLILRIVVLEDTVEGQSQWIDRQVQK